ncbi:MAG TPA: hypothetical protein VKD43_07615 [Xanthobacteraceae bacterium]|nr:hypothetical protein [Xanthobacteraceae bacterium]
MSENPSALSTIAPQPAAEGEYDLICATVAESARGRWFLDEFARRNRNADTALVLGAIQRIEAMIRGERDQQIHQSFRSDLLDMASAIARTRAEVAAVKPESQAPAVGRDLPPSAPDQRDILAAAERLQDVAWTMRERGLDARICQQIEALASSILRASSLRNPDDHRAAKLGEVLHYLERRINAMLTTCAEPGQALEQRAPAEQPAAIGRDAIDEMSTDRISTDDASTYQASPDKEVEAASAPWHGGNGHDVGASHAAILPAQDASAEPMAPAAEALDTPAANTADPAPSSVSPAAAAPAAFAPAPAASVPPAAEPSASLTIAAAPPESPASIPDEAPDAPDALPSAAASQVYDPAPAPTSAVEIEPPAAPVRAEETPVPPAVEIAAAPVESVSPVEPAPPVEIAPPAEPAPPVEIAPDPTPPATARAVIPQMELEPLVVVPVAWGKTADERPRGELEHAPIPVEPLFPERRAEAPVVAEPVVAAPVIEAPAAVASTATPAVAIESAAAPIASDPVQTAEPTARPIFRPPEAAVVFLVEYPGEDEVRPDAAAVIAASPVTIEPTPIPVANEPESPRLAHVDTPALPTSTAQPGNGLLDNGLLDAWALPVPTLLQVQPVAAPTPSVEESPAMTADTNKTPPVPAPPPADVAPPAPQPYAASRPHLLPLAEPIPQPLTPPTPSPAAQAVPAPSDPLAALRAMSPEERIALFT